MDAGSAMRSTTLRVGGGMLDQALSSLSNVLLMIAVARVAAVDDFGIIAYAYAVIAFGLGLQRSSVGPLISLATTARNHPLMVTLCWGVAVALLGGVIVRLTTGQLPNTAALILLVGSIWTHPQDALRYMAITSAKVSAAVRSDALWCSGSAVALAVTFFSKVSPEAVVVIYVITGLIATLTLTTELSPGRGRPAAWLREHAADLRLVLPDSALATSIPLIITAVVALSYSLQEVAGVRGAGTLLGPISLLLTALPLTLLPELNRLEPRRRVVLALVQSCLMSVTVLAWGIALHALPASIGHALLGQAWSPSQALLPPLTADMLFFAAASGPIAYLRTLRAWKPLLTARFWYAALIVGPLIASTFIPSVVTFYFVIALTSAANLVLLIAFAYRAGRSEHGHAST